MRILVVKMSSLGDIAAALPAVRRLQARTGAALDWVVQPEYAALVGALPFVSRVIVFPRRRAIRGFPAFRRTLRAEAYDAVVDLQGLLKSAFVAWNARLRPGGKRFGPGFAREGAGWFYDMLTTPAEERKHITDELIDVADLLVPPPAEEAPLPPLEMTLPTISLEEEAPLVVLTPFSRWATKNWAPENFAEVARQLAEERGCRIRILGGAEDAAAGAAMASSIGEAATNDCGKWNLLEMCAVLKAADLVVGVDSGPLQWADALGTPVVAVFGATDPARTGPFHQREHIVTAGNLPCRPCHKRTCVRTDLACLKTLPPAAVLHAAIRRLTRESK